MRLLKFVIAGFLAVPAVAENGMLGRWTSTMGVAVIPAGNGAFDLKIGDQHFSAQWVVLGKEFSWIDKQGKRHKAILEPNPKATPERPTRIRDVGEAFPDSPGFWYRIP